MMMVPEPWSRHESMAAELKAFYEFHSCFMEPWDGPASIAFTDGIEDRRHPRPQRPAARRAGYVDQGRPRRHGLGGRGPRLPARADRGEGAPPAGAALPRRHGARGGSSRTTEIKSRLAAEQPYGEWLRDHLVRLQELPEPPEVHEPDHETVLVRQETFGYTLEDVQDADRPDGGAGRRADRLDGDRHRRWRSSRRTPQLLFDYFKQLFAQVTNPPVDADPRGDRHGGRHGDRAGGEPPRADAAGRPPLRAPDAGPPQRRAGEDPRARRRPGTRGLPVDHPPDALRRPRGGQGAEEGDRGPADGARARRSPRGTTSSILSDRGHDAADAPIPALLALSAVQHHLLREGTRTRVGLVLETGEPREVHHFCLLIGYGASAINPYLAFETIHDQVRAGARPGRRRPRPRSATSRRSTRAIVKVISKMGISTVQSYHGAQVFEALGLSQDFVDEYFTGTPTRIGGIGIDAIAREVKLRHDCAYPGRPVEHTTLGTGGQLPVPERTARSTCSTPRRSTSCRRPAGPATTRSSRGTASSSTTRQAPGDAARPDGLPAARQAGPARRGGAGRGILARFKTGAMSYGSISQEAHEALAIAMNRVGGKSNTGEGGEDPARYQPLPGGDSKNSAIKQVASGRFGVTSQYLVERARDPDQDGPGGQAGRRGPAPGPEGLPLDREGPPRDAGRRADLAAAAPRHLLHRGPGRADPRPEERQPEGAHQRQARRGGGGRDDRGRGREGARRRGAHQRLRRRHRRLAAHEHPARRHPVGARPRRGAPGPRPQRPAGAGSPSRPTVSSRRGATS